MNLQQDPNTAVDIDLLNFDGSIWPLEVSLPFSSEQINLTLPKENVIASPGAVIMQYNANSRLDPSPTSLLASRSIIIHKSQQAPKGEV